MIPKYFFKRSAEVVREEKRKRDLESTKNVKKLKVEKEPAVNDEEGGEIDKTSKGKPAKPVTEAQRKRTEKIIATLEEICLKATTSLVQCDASDVADWIPKKLLEKGKALLPKLEASLAKGRDLALVGAEETKENMQQFFKSCSGDKKEKVAIMDKLDTCLTDAQQ